MTDRIADPWGPRTPFSPSQLDAEWPARIDQYLAPGIRDGDIDRWVQAASVLHSNGDAMDIAVMEGRIVGVRGRAVDRVNRGRLGPKDLFAWQANAAPDRLQRPLVREDGRLVETDWETAMGRIVARTQKLLAEPAGKQKISFYSTGQMFLEEYYTLGVIGKAGIGTPHMDANTRLCTATAAAALKESFGADGQPGSYRDVDFADTIALFGHNVAETQPVLWMRMLDRLHGPNPPKLVVVDPRPTVPARMADVHLAVRPGSNLALMNGLLHEIIANGWVDRAYIDAHTRGFDELAQTVAAYPSARVAEICGVDEEHIRAAARILGTAERLLSTVLQGFYQSHQATASACQVNNLHLLRGMLGRPGCGLLQMNGQPTSQNTRESGADGDFAGFRNWANEEHVKQLAAVWNVEPSVIPHAKEPTNAMEIFRQIEQGKIGFLWVVATNPLVSFPDLARTRSILAKDDLFLIVQDIFMTETAELADVVLPAAAWGEKTGTFTNTDRTVHLCERAIDPPGETKPDFEIFLDYARRMDFRDKDGHPLIPWRDPESAFAVWKECSRGCICDYTGLSYDKLRGSGVQWPCTADAPNGTERLFTDAIFPTTVERAETFGHDLATGKPFTRTQFEKFDLNRRAWLRHAEYHPSDQEPDERFPFRLTTGRTIYHFHTRTKTGRTPQLDRAAPAMWVELSPVDAERLGLAEGDIARVASGRGEILAPVRITDIKEGVVFAPFHYGSLAHGGDETIEGKRAANELTVMEWDPVSKQPYFKITPVRVEKIAGGFGPAPAPTVAASAPAEGQPRTPAPTAGGPDAEATSLLPAGAA